GGGSNSGKAEAAPNGQIVVDAVDFGAAPVMQDIFSGRYVRLARPQANPHDGVIGKRRHERLADGVDVAGDVDALPLQDCGHAACGLVHEDEVAVGGPEVDRNAVGAVLQFVERASV